MHAAGASAAWEPDAASAAAHAAAAASAATLSCLLLQVGASGLRAGNLGGAMSSAPLSMDQILTVLQTRARTEAEEAQRQLIGALNGLAALLRLADDGPGAVAKYREALAAAEAHKQEVSRGGRALLLLASMLLLRRRRSLRNALHWLLRPALLPGLLAARLCSCKLLTPALWRRVCCCAGSGAALSARRCAPTRCRCCTRCTT